MSKIGYVRVSTIDQNTDRQEIALSELGIQKLFIEKISGKNTERLQFTYDINAQEGHPSKGVMQMIDDSFKENMVAGHNNIFNPIDNIASAIGYIRRRYKDVTQVPGIVSLSRDGSYVGYKDGTEYVPKTGLYNINEETREGAETVVLPKGTGVVNATNTHNLNVLAERVPTLENALVDNIKANNMVQDMYSKWVQPINSVDYNNAYVQGAKVSNVPVMNLTQHIDKSNTYNYHMGGVNLHEVNDGEDFVNTVTRWCNTHQNGY